TGTSNTDPLSGDLYLSTTVSTQVVPGAFGVSAVNIAEAGFTVNQTTLAGVDATTNLYSRGLLVEGGGLPTTVAVQPDEYLDMLWEHKVNVPYDSTGSFNLDMDGVPTPFDFTVRPIEFTPNNGGSIAPW